MLFVNAIAGQFFNNNFNQFKNHNSLSCVYRRSQIRPLLGFVRVGQLTAGVNRPATTAVVASLSGPAVATLSGHVEYAKRFHGGFIHHEDFASNFLAALGKVLDVFGGLVVAPTVHSSKVFHDISFLLCCCHTIIIGYGCDTLGQITPRILKEIQKNPSMETAPSGQIIRIIVIQLTTTSFQPLFSLSILSIIFFFRLGMSATASLFQSVMPSL